MNKKTLPIFVLLLIVIAAVLILVQNLAAPSMPVATAPAFLSSSSTITSAPSSTVSGVQNQPASILAVTDSSGTRQLRIITVKAPKGIIMAELASTSAEQAKGLGARNSLLADHGMLFPFTYPGDYGFWMKDMLFPIDIVWISSNKKVVSVLKDVSPDTYPTVFYPPLAISYVLEINAGSAREFGIATDTQLVF